MPKPAGRMHAPLTHRPTPEREAAIASSTSGQDLVLQVGTGSGKTSTLHTLAASTRRRDRYIAFNKSIAFPSTAKCATAHALAWAVVGRRFLGRLEAPRMSSSELAAILGIRAEHRINKRHPQPLRALLRRTGHRAALLPVRRPHAGSTPRAMA